MKGTKRQEPAPAITQSLIESVVDVHESFEDMLNDFGRLQIECPEPIIEHRICPKYRPGWTVSNEACTTYQAGRDVEPWWEVDNEARSDESPASQVADQESNTTIFNTPAGVEDYEARRLVVKEAFSRMAEPFVPAQGSLQSTGLLEWETESTFSDENGGVHSEESQYSEVHSQTHESCLDREPLGDLPVADFVPGASREIITKHDGSRFVVTGMHHLTAYKPSDLNHVVELPFGSFNINKLKSILLSKLTNKVPLDCITFTGHEKHGFLAERGTCWPSHRRSLKASQWHVRTKMTPEDWHHVLMICEDDDWEDFDQMWQDFLPTVSSDFLCSICDASLPRPLHRRVWELRCGSL